MNNRFKPVIMKTNQKTNSLLLFLFFLMSYSSFYCYGQWGEINKIEKNGKRQDTLTIQVAKSNGKLEKFKINIKTSSLEASRINSGTILVLQPKTTIGIKSANTNELQILVDKKEKIVEYLVSSYRELYRSLDDNDSGNLIAKVFRPLVGDIKTANVDNTFNGAADGTEWIVSNDGENFNFKIIEGKVLISGRSKIEIDDGIIKLGGEDKRIIYKTETLGRLRAKDSIVSFNPEILIKEPLTNEEDINKFFKIESKNQKYLLRSSGTHCKSGYKLLGQGLLNEGIAEYEKAIEMGEIDMDMFIQASLILTEAIHEINSKETLANSGFKSTEINKNKQTWLDTSLHFIKKNDSISKAKHDLFRDNGHMKIAKAFGYDQVLSKEYLAWAYTVKLKLNGCLENQDQNPIVLMELATKLKDSLKSYK